jgi:ribA/ribD-fused uncharacterized protein
MTVDEPKADGTPRPPYPPVPEDGRILFYRRDRPEFGWLSHFHPAPVHMDGQDWPTVEHFYQFHKSLDPRYQRAIRACATAAEAKRCAARPRPGKPDRGSWFLAHKQDPRPDWMEIKRDLMRRADAAKFAQHPALAAALLATGEAEIVEDSPHDRFWGTGKDWTGENWTGRILMEVRAALRG